MHLRFAYGYFYAQKVSEIFNSTIQKKIENFFLVSLDHKFCNWIPKKRKDRDLFSEINNKFNSTGYDGSHNNATYHVQGLCDIDIKVKYQTYSFKSFPNIENVYDSFLVRVLSYANFFIFFLLKILDSYHSFKSHWS